MSSPVQASFIRRFSAGLALATFTVTSAGIGQAIANPLPNELLNLVDLFTDSASTDVESPTTTESTSTPSTTTTTTTDPQTAPPIDDTSPRFGCQVMNGDYTVAYYPPSQPNQAYAWATPTELGGGWTPQARCNEISRRLESYRPDGLLELKTGVENGYDTICVTTQANSSCRIVLTVPPGQDPQLTRDRVFENLAVADNGMQTDAVTTFTDSQQNAIVDELGNLLNVDLSDIPGVTTSTPRRSRDAIDLRPFLDPEDGGTGRMLNN